MPSRLFAAASLAALAAACPLCAHAETPLEAAPTPLSQVVVTQAREQPSPQTSVTITGAQALATTNASTVEETLKYLPDVLIRQRHIGDTQDPITTRTSGVGSSARSLVYVDGVLVSALIGNNNTNASPRWELVPPEAVAQAQVLYGPFAAAYPGNSIGSVILITTRTPDRFEAGLTAEGAWQDFDQYGVHDTLPTGRISGFLGDRIGRFSFRVSADHLDTEAQPLLYVTAAASAAPANGATPVTGGFAGVTRTGAPVDVLGAGGLEHQTVDTLNARLTYDLSPQVTAAYGVAFYRNLDRAQVQSFVDDAAGQPVYAGPLALGGRGYSPAASAFDNGRYHLEEDHLAQSFSLVGHRDTLDWSLVASTYDYLKDRQRMPTGALPGAETGGPGLTTSLDGTGWATLDARADWTSPALSAHRFSLGAHIDRFALENPKYVTADWIDGGAGATSTFSKGKTQTAAIWAQDAWALTPVLDLTLGGRYEHWDAFDGYNASLAPALAVRQPGLSDDAFSPKAVLAFTPDASWRFSSSIGRAYRFPTVEELYQAVTTGAVLSVPNPNLKPEDAVSEELSAQRSWRGATAASGGRLRLSLFEEHVDDALISQSASLVAGSSVLYSYVQNVGRTSAKGVELVGEQTGLAGVLDLSGWITYVQSDIQADSAFPTAVGKQLPQLPRLRGAAVATWRATPKLSATVAARYSDRAFGTIDNSDPVADTYTGFSSFFVIDLHVRYSLTQHLTADVGVDNLNDRRYFLYHPFPQRTVVAKVSWRY